MKKQDQASDKLAKGQATEEKIKELDATV
jgi:hypothetical protein